jgi:phosphatidate cytidylyltransferase
MRNSSRVGNPAVQVTMTVIWILAGLLAAVSIASLIGYLLHRHQPANPAIKNLNARIRSWWIMILLGGAALLAGSIAIIVLFALISFLALREFLPRPLVRSALFVSFFIALPVQYVLVGLGHYRLFSTLIPIYCLLALASTGVMQWGLILCVYCVSYIPAFLTLRIPGYTDRTPLLVVFVVLIAQVSDIMQYIWGKLIGRHPLVPRLSPSKTVEGLVGGVLSATLLGALLQPITPFTVSQATLMALLIAILGFLGGLVMSAIKRARGIKDWSSLIEGHGGMLDRIDSLCFSAPVFFHLTRYFFSRT